MWLQFSLWIRFCELFESFFRKFFSFSNSFPSKFFLVSFLVNKGYPVFQFFNLVVPILFVILLLVRVVHQKVANCVNLISFGLWLQFHIVQIEFNSIFCNSQLTSQRAWLAFSESANVHVPREVSRLICHLILHEVFYVEISFVNFQIGDQTRLLL